MGFVNDLAGFTEVLVRVHRVEDILCACPAYQTVLELDNLVLTLVNGLAPNSVGGSAVQFPDDDVL